MHLATTWSGNFQHLRNSLASNYNVKLLRFHTGVNTEQSVEDRRWNSQLLTPKAEERDQKSCSSKCNINPNLYNEAGRSSTYLNSWKSEVSRLKTIHYNFQQKRPDKRVFDLPATVLVFDIETTGFSHENERIIEVALRDLTGGENSTFQTLINPQKDVTNAYIHGISSHMVNRPDVPRFEELIPILLQYVRSRQMDGKPVLWFAHNGRRFDVPFIIKEFHRCFMEVPDDWLFVDTLPLARQLVKPDGSKLTSFSLKALREHYQIPLMGRAHRAMQDVTTLAYVLQRITFDLKLTVPELITRAFRASDITKVLG